MSSAMVTNDNRNVKNALWNGYSSSIRWSKHKKMECNKVIPLVLDENRWLFFILSRFLHVRGKFVSGVWLTARKAS